MTNPVSDLDELEALLADCKCTDGTLDEAIHRTAQLAHRNASKGARGQVITKWCSVDAHVVLATVEAFKVPALIARIRKLGAENAELKADQAPVTPEALAWAKEEADRLEKREAALEAVAEAARGVCAYRGAPVGCGDGETFVPTMPNLGELRAKLAALEEVKL